jgi:FkbM family methyltransferase
MPQAPQCIPDLIYDVGMNIAEGTPYYLAKGFRVVAIEANPSMVKQARDRFSSEIAAGRLTVIHAAVASRPGRIRFFVCDTMSAWSTTDLHLVAQQTRAGASFTEVEVDAVPFGEILHSYGVPHYLKVDIEGSDLLCVQALREFSERPSSLSVRRAFTHIATSLRPHPCSGTAAFS